MLAIVHIVTNNTPSGMPSLPDDSADAIWSIVGHRPGQTVWRHISLTNSDDGGDHA